jgi:ferrous iron transport protein A
MRDPFCSRVTSTNDMTEAASTAQRLKLSDLRVGEEARVGEYAEMTEYCERLIRMGLIPGTRIRLERLAPLGDPVEIRFRGYALVLRPSEAECLPLERL